MHGFFIVIEGVDGSGKTTQIEKLAPKLKEQLDSVGRNLLVVREPGGTPLGETLRRWIKANPTDSLTRALLFAASRHALQHEVLLPHLRDGGVVLCDRYIASTFAYQCYGDCLSGDTIAPLVQLATDGVLPDLTIWLDVPDAQERLEARGKDQIDAADADYRSRVRTGYQELMSGKADHPEVAKLVSHGQIVRVDAIGSEGQVAQRIMASVAAHPKMQAILHLRGRY